VPELNEKVVAGAAVLAFAGAADEEAPAAGAAGVPEPNVKVLEVHV